MAVKYWDRIVNRIKCYPIANYLGKFVVLSNSWENPKAKYVRQNGLNISRKIIFM